MSAGPGKPSLLSLTGIRKRYGHVLALQDLDLNVERGDSIALFGPNGAGKTTLLKILASLIRPDSGTIHFEGGRLQRGGVGYVSHQSLLYKDLTALENLELYARLYGLDDPRRRASEMFERMGLARHTKLRVGEFSRGMVQRLTIGRALIHDPALLLLDEPYTGLDRHSGRLLSGILKDVRDRERTLLLVTHNIREGLGSCRRLIIMNRGRIVHEADRPSFDERGFEALYFEKTEGEREGVPA